MVISNRGFRGVLGQMVTISMKVVTSLALNEAIEIVVGPTRGVAVGVGYPLARIAYGQPCLEAYLSGETPPSPATPGTTDPAEWDQNRIMAETWCDAIREDKSIYYSASACQKLQIDGRVYQEAYKNQRVSNDFDAHKKGVAGYQFRSPGEWFAEIHAAYYSGKLNKNHPARSWLSTLRRKMRRSQ
jgi:hypothetical protein